MAARSKFKAGDRVTFVYAGKRLGKRGIVAHVRKDGNLIVQFDDEPDSILVVQPYEVDKIK